MAVTKPQLTKQHKTKTFPTPENPVLEGFSFSNLMFSRPARRHTLGISLLDPSRPHVARQHLGKLAPLPDLGALPVEDVDGDGDQDGQEGQDGGRPLQPVPVADVLVHGGGVHGGDARQQVAGEAVAAGGRRGIRTVRRDHVVDRGLVDGVVGDADQAGEDERRDPGDVGRAERGPGEAEEADCQARGEVEEPVETAFGLEGARVSAEDLPVAVHEGEEGEVGDDVADDEGAECQARGDDGEVPLREDWGEGVEEDEDQGVAEAGEEGETEHDWFAHKHLERPDPDCQDFSGGDALLLQLVGPVDDGPLACLAAALGFAIDEDGAAGFRDHEEVHDLDHDSEDELDPKDPPVVEVCLNETTKDRTECAAGHRREDNERHRVLLLVRLPHIGNHAHGDGATRGGETDQKTSDNHGAEVGR